VHLAGRASYIVSGDHHLLDLDKFEEVEIVLVGKFLRLVKTHS